MKKTVFIFALVAISSYQTASADIINAVASFFGDPKEYKDTGYGVEVLNKTGKTIWVVVINATDALGTSFNHDRNPVEIKSKGLIEEGSRAFKTDINRKTALAVWQKKPTKFNVSKNVVKKGTWEVQPKPDWYVEFTPGKTAYVTVDKSGIRPQTGPRQGKAGKTNSGLSLKNNVTTGDIKRIQ